MSDTKKTSSTLPSLRIAAILTACAVMVSSCQQESVAEAGACAAAVETVAAIAPVVGGEIAAFAVLEKPKKVPELSFKDRDGKPASINDLAGKTVLFNLWATWCAPCRHEMPAFDRLEAELGGEDFAVVPVSIDKGSNEKPLGFYAETGLKHLPFYQDGTMGVFNQMRKAGYAVGLPVTLLLDKEGCVLGSLNGPAEWDSDDARRLIKAALGG